MVAQVAHLPLPGETVLASRFAVVPGGKGANQAVAAARAGADVWSVGRVGQDGSGDLLRESMDSAGVHLDFLMRDPTQPSGTALISVDDMGQNSIVVAPGANGSLSVVDIDAAAEIIKQAEVLVVQLEIPLSVVEHAIELARRSQVRIILNAAPAQPLEASLLAQVDVIIANGEEIAVLTGLGAPVDPAASARLLIESGAKAVVVTLGADGAVAVAADHETYTPAFAVESVDTTGAGDAFVGNFAAALARKRDVAGAMRFASAAAAISVTRSGAQPSMPTEAETETLLREESAS